MYKDKDKQREANAERQRRYKAKQKALLSEGVTDKALLNINAGEISERLESREPFDVIPCGTEAKAREISDSRIKPKPKRGKDIKCFADLHPGIQQTIVKMSTTDGRLDKDEKAKRTTAAIKYQHLFPDRYEPHGAVCTGVATGLPGDEDYNGVCTPEWRAERGR